MCCLWYMLAIYRQYWQYCRQKLNVCKEKWIGSWTVSSPNILWTISNYVPGWQVMFPLSALPPRWMWISSMMRSVQSVILCNQALRRSCLGLRITEAYFVINMSLDPVDAQSENHCCIKLCFCQNALQRCTHSLPLQHYRILWMQIISDWQTTSSSDTSGLRACAVLIVRRMFITFWERCRFCGPHDYWVHIPPDLHCREKVVRLVSTWFSFDCCN